jgi:hypothetical protein
MSTGLSDGRVYKNETRITFVVESPSFLQDQRPNAHAQHTRLAIGDGRQGSHVSVYYPMEKVGVCQNIRYSQDVQLVGLWNGKRYRNGMGSITSHNTHSRSTLRWKDTVDVHHAWQSSNKIVLGPQHATSRINGRSRYRSSKLLRLSTLENQVEKNVL